ncbi:MAG TPA: UDP-N-acetylmuramoyl-L-alanyl-D-glutamate--2,6-diaminopimelate ligase [Patescibacteria group bacterium]|nr:UDP-N-acetylmuramoyl-L-alanyl-D-glutamate--2,6-diaminopimelate ligase [Patescibacteria group bacterium]
MIRRLKGLYHLIIALVANIWFGFPAKKITIIGVTGTDGKTTTTTLIYEILKSAGYKVSMISTVHAVIGGTSYDTGFHVTTPDSFFIQGYIRKAVDHGDTHMILEVTSHGLAQHRVFGIPFAIGVITNVTHEHLDWHKTFKEYLNTKISLLTRSKVAVINRDESELFNTAMPLLRSREVFTYGIRRQAKITPTLYPFSTKLLGEFNRYNCLAAIAAVSALGVPFSVTKKVIAGFSGVLGRMEVITTKPFTVIVDFAHTPNAIDRALRSAKKLTKKRVIHVFGSAGLRDHSKRPLMGRASSQYAHTIILTEEDYRTEDVTVIMDAIQTGIKSSVPVYRYPNRGKAIAYALSIARPGDLVIITGKGHERSLCRGTKEYPWSDQAEVRKLLHIKAS